MVQSGVYEEFVDMKDASVTRLSNKCLQSKETVLHEELNFCSW